LTDLLFVDVETTGTDYEKCRILQVALILTDYDGRETNRLQLNVLPRPPFMVDPSALRVNGIDLRTHTGVDEVDTVIAINKFLEDNHVVRCNLAGWNASFDYMFLMELCKRNGGVGVLIRERISYSLLDVKSIAAVFDEHYYPGNLADTCEKHGIELVDAHTAMADIEATLKLYRKLRRKVQL
jgi:DNA polymerase III epsilon subunit-like protein